MYMYLLIQQMCWTSVFEDSSECSDLTKCSSSCRPKCLIIESPSQASWNPQARQCGLCSFNSSTRCVCASVCACVCVCVCVCVCECVCSTYMYMYMYILITCTCTKRSGKRP